MGKTSSIALGLGIVLGLLGSALLVGFGIRYLKPYLQVRTMLEGTCQVTSVGLREGLVTCMCGRDSGSDCRSYYPCLKILVNFTSYKWETSMHNVTLYDSFETFGLQRDKLQCSYHKCDRSQSRNIQTIKHFQERYGVPGFTYTCYYEPSDPSYAIFHVVTLTTAVHTILWPSMAFVAGFGMVMGYVFCRTPSSKRTFNTSSLERVKNINRDNRYERVSSR